MSGVERQTCLAMSSNCLPLPDSRFWIVKPKSFAFSDTKVPITERNTSYLIHQSSLLVSLFHNTTKRTLLHQSCRWRLVICAFTYSYCFPLLLNYPELHAMKRRHLEVRQNRSLFFFSDLRESRLNFFFFFFFNTREPSLVLITAKQYEKQKSYTFHYITNNQVSEGVVKHIYREGWEVRSL